jgi:hypothetical protein
LATSGIDTEDGLISQCSPDGNLLRKFHLGIGQGFLNDFALDRANGRLYAVGSCGYTGGMAALSLETGQAAVLVPPRGGYPGAAGDVCGQRIALESPGEIVVGRVNALYAAVAPYSGTLVYIGTADGKVRRKAKVSAEPLDVLVL